MEIGNIVSKTPIETNVGFNLVESIDDIIEGIPTLIVGHNIVKEKYGEDLDFMDRVIGDMDDEIFWTFTKEEQRKYHMIDVNTFINYCYQKSVDHINYVFVDPIQFKFTQLKKVIKKIKTIKKPISFYHEEKNMIYIYGDNLIFGIDLKLVRFIGIDDNKVKSKINVISTVFLEGSEILIEYKDYLERLGNQAKYIPFLYSMSTYE